MFINLSILARTWTGRRRRNREAKRKRRSGPLIERLEERIALSIAPDLFEPNDSLQAAPFLGQGLGLQLANLSLHSPGDQDWFQFQLLRSDQVRISAQTDLGSAVDISLFDSNGNQLSSGLWENGQAAATTQLNPGRYYARIVSAAGEIDTYTLRILPGPESTTRLFYVNDASLVNDVYSLAVGNNANSGLSPLAPKASVSNVLSTYDINPGDIILIDTGSYNESPNVLAPDEGAIYTGSFRGTSLSSFNIQDADSNVVYGLTMSRISVSGSWPAGAADNALIANRLSAQTGTAINVSNATGTTIEGNTITGGHDAGIALSGQGLAKVTGNIIEGVRTGVTLTSTQTPLASEIRGNTITARTIGSTIGIQVSGQADPSTLITENILGGFATAGIEIVSGSSSALTVSRNIVTNAGVGIRSSQSAAVVIVGNTISGGGVGIRARGLIGGQNWDEGQFNTISGANVGIETDASNTTVQFNRLFDNTVGITVSHNDVIVRNNVAAGNGTGVMVTGAQRTSIVNNTIYSSSAVGVHVRNSASDARLTNNIIWAVAGYGLRVENNSQLNFQSNYNNLYQSGSGRIVWWQKPFDDLFDWQVEANLDVDSIGYTAIAPNLDNPLFVDLAARDFRLLSGSTSIDAGDPASSSLLEPSPNGGRIDLGAYGNTALATPSNIAAVELVYPNYYSDWEASVGRAIRWRSYGVTGDVRIELLQRQLDGSWTTLSTVAVVPVAAGTYTWSPSQAGIQAGSPGRYGLRISSVANPAVSDTTREWFSVPVSGPDFYINDGSTSGDQYTTAVGNNRNTGRTPADPKANLIPLLRSYDLDPGHTVWVDAGTYINVRDIVLSGQLGVGDDEGMRILGPDSGYGAAILDRGNTASTTVGVDVNGADFTEIRRITFAGGGRGLWVRNNSTNFLGFDLVATGNSVAGIDVESSATGSVLNRLRADDNGGVGISIAVPLATFSGGSARGNSGVGISLSGVSGMEVYNLVVENNQGGGLSVSATNVYVHDVVATGNGGSGVSVSGQNMRVQSIVSTDNSGAGISANGTGLVGDTDLSSGEGNRVERNSIGISTGGGVTIAGNAVLSNTSRGISFGAASAPASPLTTVRRNVVAGNRVGIFGYTGLIVENRIYGSSEEGLYLYYSSNVERNTIYSNRVGMVIDWYQVFIWPSYHEFRFADTVSGNLVYDNWQDAIQLKGSRGARITNNTIYQPEGNGITFVSDATGTVISNNIIWVSAPNKYIYNVSSDSRSGFSSDFNLLRATGGAKLAQWANLERATFSEWQRANYFDLNSIDADPLFVDMDGGDGVLGANYSSDGSDDNFHVQSLYGSYKGNAAAPGGGFAPVLDPSTRLPKLVSGAFTADLAQSPAIDRGDAASPFTNEPAPNGGYIEIGAYGNTSQASLSPESYVLVVNPNGGQSWSIGETFPIRWRTNETRAGGGTVSIELRRVGQATPVLAIAQNIADNGLYPWTIPTEVSPGDDYLIRVYRAGAEDVSDSPLAITPRINRYYVNDGVVQDGDWTTAPGSFLNDGKSPDRPSDSIRAILDAYDLGPGDEIWVDAGIYAIGANILIDASDSGVKIIGNRNPVLDRQEALNPQSAVFQILGASDVVIDGFQLRGGNTAVLAGAGANIVIQNSEFFSNSYAAVVASGAGFQFLDNQVRDSAHGVFSTGPTSVVVGNSFSGHAGSSLWTGSFTVYRGAVSLEGANGLVSGNTIVTSPYAVSARGAGAIIDGNVIDGGLIQTTAANIVVRSNTLTGGGNHGIQADATGAGVVVEGNSVTGKSSYSIYALAGSLVTNNAVFGNSYGIYSSGTVASNVVYSNQVGIEGSGGSVVDNIVYGNSNTGISLFSGAAAENNIVYDNVTGVRASGGTVRGNRIYANQTGVVAYEGVRVEGNRVYSNHVGIQNVEFSGQFTGLLANNLVYANSSAGIRLSYASGARVENNTIYQLQGTALDFRDITSGNGSNNLSLRNNVVSALGVATALDVGPLSQRGLSSDYNLFHLGESATFARWDDVVFTNRADWVYELGLDVHSRFADPLYADPAGPDGVLGVAIPAGQPSFIVDDGDPAFSTTGNWYPLSQGYQGDSRYSSIPPSTAQWNFNGLTAGQWYRVAATWPVGGSNVTAPFEVLQEGQVVRSWSYSSTQPPVGFHADGVAWQVFGYVRASGGPVTVRVRIPSNGYTTNIDAVRLDPVVGIEASDDDFSFLPGSPVIDAGDPASLVLSEPYPNGGRINLGHLGGTSLATPSAFQSVQLLSPNGLEKLIVGKPVEVAWRTSGLADFNRLGQLDLGTTAPTAGWLADAFLLNSSQSSNTSFTQSVNTSAAQDPAPLSVYQSSRARYNAPLAWQIPAADGQYTLRLHFATDASSANRDRFSVRVQGATAVADYDIFTAAGGQYRASVLEVSAVAAGGQGISLELVPLTNRYARISGIEILRVNSNPVPDATFDLDVSYDAGQSWQPIASGLAVDRYGLGRATWTPTVETAGNSALVRVRSGELSDRSDEPFLIANAGKLYYVNDASTTDDRFTSAIGNNLNSGKSPDAPMASLAALLAAYDLEPGDVVHVDAGTYRLLRNIRFEQNQSGQAGVPILVTGPSDAVATLDRGNRGNGSYAIEFLGADHVTLRHLNVTGGYSGVVALGGRDSDDVTLDLMLVTGNYQYGVYWEGTNDRLTVTNSEFVTTSGPPSIGTLQSGAIYTTSYYDYSQGRNWDSYDIRIENNLFRTLTGSGYVSISGPYALAHDNELQGVSLSVYGAGAVAVRNLFSGVGSSGTALSIGGSALTSGGTIIAATARDNRILNWASGISASNALVVGNTVVGRSNRDGTGISASGGTTVRDNVVSSFSTGVFAAGAILAENNRVYNNSSVGIQVSSGSGTIRGNVVYSNAGGGIEGGGWVEGNLVYANSNFGYRSYFGDFTLIGNTIVQLASPAVVVYYSSNQGTLRNNILSTRVGSILRFDQPYSEGPRLASNYNLFWQDGPATIASYAGIAFATLSDWYFFSGQDGDSLASDPRFVNPVGGDGVLGYVSAAQDGRDDDFHLQSPFGVVAGGLLAPVLDAASGLPIYLSTTLTYSAVLSPAVDRGQPSDPFSLEPGANGGRVNLGAYGNTPLASQSPEAALQILSPWAYAKFEHGQSVAIAWRAAGFGPGEMVHIDLVRDGEAEPVLRIASVLAASGAYSWTVPNSIPDGADYRICVERAADSSFREASYAPIAIANSGPDYFISPTGNDRNTGKSANAPMATLRALLAAYDLDPGDVVHVAAGNYSLIADLVVSPQDSGVRFLGENVNTTILNRGGNGSYVIQLATGTSDVAIENLSLTGGQYGVYGSQATRATIVGNRIYGNTSVGIQLDTNSNFAVIAANEIFGTVLAPQSNGIYVSAADGLVENNRIYGLASGGVLGGITVAGPRTIVRGNEISGAPARAISATSNSTAAANWILVENNVISNGSSDGIVATDARVRGNTVYGRTGTSVEGIVAIRGEVVGNVVYLNTVGIFAQSDTVVADNRVFANVQTGISASGGVRIERNKVYSNTTGIEAGSTSTLLNNIVYANTNTALRITGSSVTVTNNTLVQNVGDAVRIEAGTATLRNNIIATDRGYGINVTSTSGQSGFASSDNLIRISTDPLAFTGRWAAVDRKTLADWQSASGQDTRSLADDPLFVDRDGADNILGYTTAAGGYDGGIDDNFQLRAGSPAIDRGNTWLSVATDAEGFGRLDDPGSPNAGTPDYQAVTLAESLFATVGTARNWRGNGTWWTLSFTGGFVFPFYGQNYTSVIVSSEGFLQFGSSTNGGDGNNSTSALITGPRRIAPLWDNLRTNGTGDDVFVDTTVAGQVTIRWNATNEADNSDVQFAVVLFADGRFRFDYGPGNTGLSPTSGISRGDARFFVLPENNGQATLTNAPSILFDLNPGYVDIGAYEFRGSTLDATPPTISAVTPAEVGDDGALAALTTQIVLSFSEEMNTIDRIAASNYELRFAGANGLLGDGDDALIPVTISVVTGENSVRLAIPRLAGGLYRLTVRGDSLRDLAGNPLDGDNDGLAGGHFVRTFNVPHPGLLLSASEVETSEDGNAAEVLVRLRLQPTANVTVSAATSNAGEGTVAPSTLVFTPTNWHVPQTLTITGVDDAVLDGDVPFQINLSLASSDPFYAGIAPVTIQAINRDDEIPNLPPVIEPIADLTVGEGDFVQVAVYAVDPEGLPLHYSLAAGAPDGSAIDPETGVFTWTPLDDAPPVAVTILVTDAGDPAETRFVSFQISVVNAPPELTISGPAAIWLDEIFTLSLAATDPSPVDQSAGFTYRIDWDGDGTIDQEVTGGGAIEATHSFASPGWFQVRAASVDKDGAASDWQTLDVLVQHRPQLVLFAETSATSPQQIAVELSVSHFEADPVLGHLVHIDWNDDGVVDQIVATGLAGTRIEHDFDSFGLKVVRAWLIDPASGESRAESTVALWLAPFETQPDIQTGLRHLIWQGTDGDDDYRFEELDPNRVRVVVLQENGAMVGQSLVIAGVSGHVEVYLGDGNDRADASLLVTKPLRGFGGDGDDTIHGGQADDFLFGGTRGGQTFDGDDVLYGHGGDDTLLGQQGSDTIYGGDGDDKIWGGDWDQTQPDGGDFIYGDAGADTIHGGGGNDTLLGGDGPDVLLGEAGNDLLYAHRAGDHSTLYAETLLGGAGGDTIHGSDGPDAILGGDSLGSIGDGNDLIFAYGGDDTLFGNAGSDTIFSGDGDDLVFGGWIGDNETDDADFIDAGPGDDGVLGGDGDDTILGHDGSDTLLGGRGNDFIDAGAGDDIVTGDEGDDTIYGGDGEDVVFAGDGHDWVDGGDGIDALLGQDGDDTLYGGNGSDLVIGGNGADRLFGQADRDVLIGGDGADRIEGGDGDDILVAGTIPSALDIVDLVLAEWLSNNSYAQRVANLRGPGDESRLNGDTFLAPGLLLFDDGAADTLLGEAGLDWFFHDDDVDQMPDKDGSEEEDVLV